MKTLHSGRNEEPTLYQNDEQLVTNSDDIFLVMNINLQIVSQFWYRSQKGLVTNSS